MHKLIVALVSAESKEEAVSWGKQIGDNLIDEGIYDYYVAFDEDVSVAGKRRWGDYEPAYYLESEMGKKLIEERLQFTLEDIKEGLDRIKKGIEKEIKEVIKDDVLRYWFHLIGSDESTLPWIYGENKGILTEDEFRELTEGKENEFWVVPLDVHY